VLTRRSLLGLLALGVEACSRVKVVVQPQPAPVAPVEPTVPIVFQGGSIARPPAGGGGGGASGTHYGFNLAPGNYYSAQRNFLNMVHDGGSTGFWSTWPDPDGPSQYVADSFSWPVNVPPGGVFLYYVRLDTDAIGGYCKTGGYVAKTTSGFTLSVVNDNNCSSLTSAVNQATWNVDSSASAHFSIKFTNATAGNLSITPGDFYVCHVDDEAALVGGQIFHPDLLAKFAGCSVVRAMDCIRTIDPVWRTTANIPTPSNFLAGPWPPEYVAELAKALGCGIHWSQPAAMEKKYYKCENAGDLVGLWDYNHTVQEVLTWVNGDQFCFSGDDADLPAAGMDFGPYYIVNANYSTNKFQLSTTPGGSPITFTTDTGPTYRNACSRLFDQDSVIDACISRLYTVYPACPRLWAEYSCEAWNSIFSILRWLNTTGAYVVTGTRVGDGAFGARAYGHMSLKLWEIAENYFSRSVVRRTFGGQCVYVGSMQEGLDVVDPGYLNTGTKVGALMDAVCLAPYFSVNDSTYGAQPPYSEEYAYDADDPYGFSSGGYLTTLNAQSWTDTQWATAIKSSLPEVINGMNQWRTAMDTYKSGTLMTTYECGPHFWHYITPARTPNDQAQQIQESYINFWFNSTSSSAVQCRQDYKTLCFDNFSMVNAVQYVGGGRWYYQSSYIESWGIYPHWEAAENQASTFWKTSFASGVA
jgi:hypothetical protein